MTTEKEILDTLTKLNRVLGTMSQTASAAPLKAGSRGRDKDVLAARNAVRDATTVLTSTATHVKKLGDRAQSAAENVGALSKAAYSGSRKLDELTTSFEKSAVSISSATSALDTLSKSKIGEFGTSADLLNKAVISAATSISNIRVADITSSDIAGALTDATQSFTFEAIQNFDLLNSTFKGAIIDLGKVRNEVKGITGESLGLSGLPTKITALENVLVGPDGRAGLSKQVVRATNYFKSFNKAIIDAIRGTRKGGSGGSGGGGGGGGDDDGPSAAPAGKPNKDASSFGRAILERSLLAPANFMAEQVIESMVRVIDSAFQTTAARGFGGLFSSTFYELSIDAAAAGMSLQEYTKDVIEANEGLMSRSGSFDELNDRLTSSAKGLEQFGIFGQEGIKMAAAIQQSSSTLGVPMSNLEDSTNAQIKVFDKLRKTTGMTAEQFTDMMVTMKDNEVVQRELIALAPMERSTRLAQIVDISSWGKQLGLSENAARQLSEALINQRKATVKERFQARGRLNQAMALAGMDSSKIAEASSLVSKRVRTEDEDKRLVQLLGEYGQRSEQAIQFGGPGMQYQFEAMNEKLAETGNLKQLMDASLAVVGAQESGPQIQKETNQKLSALDTTIGNLITKLEGLSNSPLLMGGIGMLGIIATSQLWKTSLATSIGTAVATAIRPLLATVMKPELMGPPKPGVDVPEGGGKGGKGGKLAAVGSGALKFLKSPIGIGMIGSIVGYGLEAIGSKMTDGPAKAVVSVLSDTATYAGLGATFGSLLGPIGTAVGAAAGALIGLGKGLWDNWDKLFGSNEDAAKATEANTEQIKKNNEIIKARREGAGSSVISMTDLTSVPSNVARTAAAYDPTIKPQTGTQIATPTQQAPKTVATPESVNTEPVSNVTKPAAPAQKMAANPMPDAAATLVQILEVLKQSLGAESQQVELADRLLRSLSTTRPASKEALVDRAVR